MRNVVIDFNGDFLKYGVYEAADDELGLPIHPVTCECDGPLKCRYWAFRPHPKQIRFFDSLSPRLMFGGGRGPGKTESLVWKPIYTAFAVPGAKMLCFRRTMGELRKTILQRFKDLESWGLYEKCTEDAITFQDNGMLWFGSADDEKAMRKLLSGEYILIEFDEWSEFPLSWWKFAEGSCRAPVTQDRFGRNVVAQVCGATNPGGVGGASLAALFNADGKGKRQAPGEDPTLYDSKDYEFIPALIGDNPTYAAGTAAGDAYRKMLASQPRRIQAAWIYGRWDGFEGQYFDCLEEDCTLIPHDVFLKMIRKQHWAPRWISIDWGMTHHASVGWHALMSVAGRDIPITYRSYLCRGLGESALAEEICDLTEAGCYGEKEKEHIVKVYLSPETFGDSGHSRARRIGDVFATRGLPRPMPANNKREDGWRLMHDLLRARRSITLGDNGTNLRSQTVCDWLITDHNVYPVPKEGAWPTPIECLLQAVCDPKKDGDVLKDGDAVHLDVNDQLRYGIASHISPEARPFDDRLQEHLAALPVAGPSRYIEHLKMAKEERDRPYGGVFYIGKQRRRR
jgi:phage terminase large subunit